MVRGFAAPGALDDVEVQPSASTGVAVTAVREDVTPAFARGSPHVRPAVAGARAAVGSITPVQGWGAVAVALSALLSGAVLGVSWWLNRRAWRERVDADRRWLHARGVDPGEAPPVPAAWRLVLTGDLAPDGSFLLDLAEQDVAARPGDRSRR
ncbi:hypothetical protein MO973_28020 [Paenibacillus sp. TRM 82003]|uniref:hypothetical protein n=1 Tax=Kineococcus sp. TRM81007 TaxID=2925831 RepID=UPI001F59E55B|nr:hypothetical protein [Kineococcus sp. TRM81007]MCI2238247.1 hypothetical protein [Kineococcus sp. TRM81007]MCI3924081.1 hypothetical protein [Paenibacillus sp. TRM 82003]